MKIMKILIVLASLLLSGCLVQPEYNPAFANIGMICTISIIGLIFVCWICSIVKLRKCLELRGL